MKNLLITKILQNSKIKILVVCFLVFFKPASACEICGCSINGYHFGILPQISKNVIGIKHTYRSFQSQHLISEQLYILGNKSKEYYNSTELWARCNINPKVMLMAFVPYNNFSTNDGKGKTTAHGIGDATILANYVLYNDATEKKKNFRQTFLIGGGVKLPTGKFSNTNNGTTLNPSINTGSGSVDYLANIIYNCRYKKVGANTEVSYRKNTTNGDDFKYGNRFVTTVKFFYWKNFGIKTTILPHMGLLYENALKDKHDKQIQNFSGGNITSLTAGFEVYRGKMNIGFVFSHPLSQNMFKGLVVNDNQLSINASFIF